ncbi:MAG TPA: aromatic ring-hydroxylating dioxygenase subunit alpha [Candidatus Acidoferrales bacterium]|nr:aromatic ring-hydroxylating dioxygenase subunit alpha [Candidatus Acidoferrales bacterium]
MPTLASNPAPISPDALARSTAVFGASFTLPGEAYRSAEVFAWEMEHFFECGWVCLGREEETGRAGDYRALRIGREGILLSRDAGGRLHAFFNVCRHRAHELLEPGACANARAIRCPYHGWVYELDGRLKTAARFGDVACFDAAGTGLVPVRVETWHGWVFVNADAQAPPLDAWTGELTRLVASHAPGELRIGARSSYEVAANWKILIENYHECYHCAQIHPQLCRVSPPESGRNPPHDGAWIGGSMELAQGAQTMSLDGVSHGEFLPGLGASQRRLVYYYGLFPNLLISPHPDYVLTHRLEPLAPDRTRVECHWLFPPETIARAGFSPNYAVEFWDVTNRQDWRACQSVQRGASSAGYRQGPLSEREEMVYRFVSHVARSYLTGRYEPVTAE